MTSTTTRTDDRKQANKDRRPILLDPSSSQAGIAAALRRAFAGKEQPGDCDRDDEFDRLLAQIY